ncbi:ac29-like protein [Clanis bilineata nucleopolyhedrovirus]|uniref:Ac29-like protein n=1 Tax=Clanis bilineata nucleopolyhedrovirus TaxID=1307957 RepID=Q0N480_9ABAC|nr:ac29-like protein [Clanis bilineata nucleopolyhedrovirus]ABF47363.1 ac29-like protein [Clanis bilineata nucleopolyhedrovirus]
MPVFRRSEAHHKQILLAKSQNDSLREQLNAIVAAKKNLNIKMQHWEKLKRITKDPQEIAAIDSELNKLRMEFLSFSVKKF